MNCQYCGKKIGIIENWRYGRFCSKEHQDEFRDEAAQLAASVLGSRPAEGDIHNERVQVRNPQSKQMELAGEPAAEPDPPRMEEVEQEGAAAVEWKPKPAPAITEGRDRAANERHQRALRILTANHRMPPPVLEKDRRRRLKFEDAPYRFGDVEAAGDRSVLVPPSGAVQKRPKLQFCDRLLRLGAEDEPQAALPEFQCAWEGSGVWTVEAADPGELDFGDYLNDYTPEQPWEQWDWDALLAEAKYAQSMNEERDRRLNKLRAQQPGMPAPGVGGQANAGARQPGLPAMPGYPSRTPAAAQPPGMPRAMPSLQAKPAVPAGGVGGRAAQPGVAGLTAGGQGPVSGLAGGFVVPAMPSYPGRMALRPVGGPTAGQAGAMGAAKAGPGQLVRIVGAGGAQATPMEWVELAPPLFLALSKIEDPPPVLIPPRSRPVEAVPEVAGPEPGASMPGYDSGTRRAAMTGICEELEPSPEPRRVAPEPFRWKELRPEAEAGGHEPLRPEYRLAARRFRVVPAPAGDRRTLNLRPVARVARPDPGMVLDGREWMAG